MSEKFEQVCPCERCGTEAEVVVTCSLEEDRPQGAFPAVVPKAEGQLKGHAVCSHCGSEEDIWLNP